MVLDVTVGIYCQTMSPRLLASPWIEWVRVVKDDLAGDVCI